MLYENTLYLQIRFAKQLGTQLERFKIKKDSPFHGNARCPICGDSHKSKTKARFHIIERSGSLFVHCFNCDLSGSFITFIKNHYQSLYSEYTFDRIRITEPKRIQPTEIDPARFIVKTIPKGLDLPLVSDLNKDHPCRMYVESRKLPTYPFQYASKFYAFCSNFNEEMKYDPKIKDESRLIIPFFNKKGNIYAFQGRDLEGRSLKKYITIYIDKNSPKFFGLDRLNTKSPIIIVEGPLDSLFLDNCIASVNASLLSTKKKISPLLNNTPITLVYDNEPRNKVIVDMYSEAIDSGCSIVIWPKKYEGIKDINDLVLKGYSPQKIISQNTYSGILARIKFQEWKKI